MTIVPTSRPPIPTVSRPAVQPTASASPMQGSAIDPIKLLKKYKWILAASVGAGFIIGTIAHYTMLKVYPIFSSAITYECFAPEDSVGSMRTTSSEKELETFKATQVQILLSDRIIDKAVADPSLPREAKKWCEQFMRKGVFDTAKAAKELKKNLSAAVAGQSNFVRVSFWWTDPDEVAAVVKSVGRSYERDRRQVGSQDISEKKTLLAQAVADTTETISKRQRERQRILGDAEADTLNEQVSSANHNIEKIQTELVKVRVDKDALVVMRNQLEDELKSISTPKIPDDIRDQVERESAVATLKQEVNMLESEMLAMRNRLGSEHPDIRRLQTRLDARRQTLDSERTRLQRQAFDGRLDRYRTNVSSMEAQEASLLKKLEESQKRAVELTQILAQVNDITKDIDNLTFQRNRLSQDLKELDVLTSSPKNTSRVVLFQDAQSPKTVSFPRLMIMVPATIFIFLSLTAGVILLLEIVDQRVKSPADIAMIPRTRVLGLVPHAAEDPAAPAKIETVFRDQPSGVLAESYRQLRGTVLKRMHAGGHKTLVCMSGMPGSGTTTFVVNLASAMAASEQKVLVIDANFRRPSIHRVLGLAETPGLADVVAGSKTLAEAVQSAGDNFSVLSAGTSSARQYERLSSAAMAALLKSAAAEYDIVLLDVAPAMVAGDAVSLANRCDASLLVVRALGEKRGMVARLRNELSESRAEFLGVVVNAVRSAAGGYLKGNIQATHTYQLGPGNGKA